MTNQTPTTLAEPLNRIAVSISGGGFRASAFGLGCLSYLSRCQLTTNGESHSLLHRLEFISSTSGGSFVSLLYAQYLYTNKSFHDFYTDLREIMTGETLLREAMQLLEDDSAWTHVRKQRNLINAFSLAYDRRFGGTTLNLLNNPDDVRHLRQICVNSTEFHNGISFRFQNIDGQTRTGLVGNYELNLNLTNTAEALAIIGKLKLADMMAASSCFPGGFEPLLFPRDFTYRSQTGRPALTAAELRSTIYCNDTLKRTAELTRQATGPILPASEVQLTLLAENEDEQETGVNSGGSQKTPVKDDFSFGLMDGGVDDNQGLIGLILADKRDRNRTKQGFDTLIVCDVDSPGLDGGYRLPEVNNTGIRGLTVRALALLIGFVLGLVPIGLGLLLPEPTGRIALITFGLTILLLEGGLLVWLWRKIQSVQASGTWGGVLHRYGGYFFTVPVGTLIQMIGARLDSLVLLAGSIFMAQVRRLIYQQFYSNRDYLNRRVTALIYELSRDNYPLTKARNRKNHEDSLPEPSALMQQTAQDARDMATTLWFDAKDVSANTRDKIIATGQFTMCYNLLQYINRVRTVEMTAEYKAALDSLKKDLLDDWDKFQKNPLWLVDHL